MASNTSETSGSTDVPLSANKVDGRLTSYKTAVNPNCAVTNNSEPSAGKSLTADGGSCRKLVIQCERLCTCIAVALGAYIGVAIRITCSILVNRYSHNSDVLPEVGDGFFLPNIIGCFILGFVATVACKSDLWPIAKAGIGSGLCGSCTTFASWQLFVALGFLRIDVIDMLAVSLITVATSYCSYLWGRQLAEWWNARINECNGCGRSGKRKPEQNGNESDMEGSKQLMHVNESTL